MSKVLTVADKRQLFVDDMLIEKMDRVMLRLHEPVSGGTAIVADRPWEDTCISRRSVILHNGRYYMYYRAMNIEVDKGGGALCVALSDDGVTWEKPSLGVAECEGSRDTNIVAYEKTCFEM